MEPINKLLDKLNNNLPIAYALIRFFLGSALFVRGWIFLTNPDTVIELARAESMHIWFSYITLGHLIGGLLLIIGLFSRLASLFQIPILFGAVFVVNNSESLASVNQSLEVAVMVLVLLIIYFFFGSGPLSVDAMLQKRSTKSVREGNQYVVPS